jgi:Arc/MetJ-type ribon-helix-helix transcriptional regulator
MSAITVLVPDPASAFLEAKVASGEYANASDYVSELILRDQPLSAEDAKWLVEFDASIARGVADSKAGRVIDADVLLTELEARYSAMEEPRRGKVGGTCHA